MKRIAIITAAALLAGSAAAQESKYDIGGALLDHDILSAPAVFSLSQQQTFGTARSMGMGGAFTSLGADLASVAINPAGLGMYRHNDVSITPALGISHAHNRGGSLYNYGDNNSTRFTVNSVGASFKVHEGSGNLVAVNFAIAYNKVADYNYSTSFSSLGDVSSYADLLATQANAAGLGINNDNKINMGGLVDYDMNPYQWNAVLGYKAGLIDIPEGGNGMWFPNEIGNGAVIDQFYNLKSRGSAGEYSFAVGFNINNIVYLGASLDIPSIDRRQDIYYGEEIRYPDGAPSGKDTPYQLDYFNYNQVTRVNGSGVGAKFGVTVRPVANLRIGFAVHTPRYYSVTYRYQAQMSSRAYSAGDNPAGYELENGFVYADETSPLLIDDGAYKWNFTTPTRLLAGISYTVGSVAAFALDYQYDAYGGVRVKHAPYLETGGFNSLLREYMKGSHTVRAGIEVKPAPVVALRVGGGYTSRMVVRDVMFSESVPADAWYCTAGVGFRLSPIVYLDLAYSYRKDDYTDYRLYYAINKTNPADVNQSGEFSTDYSRHNIALTLGFRF